MCVFCEIVARRAPAAIVLEDEHTLAFVDLRQANPGHVLVIPKVHIPDVRHLDAEVGAALMHSVVRITRAVGVAFPNDGLSLWHSIGPAAFQEVPHLHIHVHPRLLSDGLLQVYPTLPENVDSDTLHLLAERVKSALQALT
ncbi:MAG: HIT domain-containing protein [Gemmatimonadetes bacterium]|nr:HIT domain-containing protein [Gemmatimonadota bacterium]